MVSRLEDVAFVLRGLMEILKLEYECHEIVGEFNEFLGYERLLFKKGKLIYSEGEVEPHQEITWLDEIDDEED